MSIRNNAGEDDIMKPQYTAVIDNTTILALELLIDASAHGGLCKLS